MARTKRRPYTKSKRFDRSCRNHGNCDYCKSNRTHQGTKAQAVAVDQLRENT